MTSLASCSQAPPTRPVAAPERRGRALPAHLQHAAALERRDAPARARVVPSPDGLEPAPAGRLRRARPRRPDLRDPPPARRDRRSRARDHGPGGRGLRSQRHRDRRLGRGRRPGAAAPLARRGRRHARGAAGERLGRGRPDPDARRLPDRVEQDPRAPAGGGLAAGGQADARGVRRGARRLAGRLGAAARGVGRPLRRTHAADRRAAHEPPRSDAGRNAGRLRAHDAALVEPGPRRPRRAGPRRRADVLRQLEHAQPGEHRHRHRAASASRRSSTSWRPCPRATS